MTPTTRFARRALGLLVLGVVAFTIYGSLVPFDFRSRDMGEAANSFFWAMQHRWWVESRSDGLANVMLGVPLGFGLLGLFRTGTSDRRRDGLIGAMLLPACLLFAGIVEFAQLYVPSRTCAGSDVLCQGFGSLIGMTVWVLVGRWLVRQAEEIWSGADAAGRLLIVYLVLLAFVQLLPMDLTASPRDLYRKFRDDVVNIPFLEFRTIEGTKVVAKLLQVFGLYVPIGLLASRSLKHPWSSRCVWLAFGIAFIMEGLQLIVHSRTPSATDVLIGASGALAGWWLAKRETPWIVLYAVWFLGLAFISWQPFVLVVNPPLPFGWIPGLPLEQGNPLFALEEMITKLVLFALGGVLLKSIPQAIALGLVVSAIFEVGQTVFAFHSPSVTDVLLGGMGAALGARMTAACGIAISDGPQ